MTHIRPITCYPFDADKALEIARTRSLSFFSKKTNEITEDEIEYLLKNNPY